MGLTKGAIIYQKLNNSYLFLTGRSGVSLSLDPLFLGNTEIIYKQNVNKFNVLSPAKLYLAYISTQLSSITHSATHGNHGIKNCVLQKEVYGYE